MELFFNEIENVYNDLVHLHLHTTYSFLDGANKISDCIKRVKELGMTTVAITDHNHTGGWYEFRDECAKNNVKPIFGCELYQTWDTKILSLSADERRDLAIKNYTAATGFEIPDKIGKKKITKKQINEIIKDYAYDTKQYHIILLAMNQTGLNNLIKLQSEAADTCTYNGRFCCDLDLLEKYNEGIICLSACLGGIIPSTLRKDETKARELIERFKNIFGDRLYLEIQPYFSEQQSFVNRKLVDLANEYNIKYVATNDVHYTNKEDMDDHDTLLCVGLGKSKDDPERMRYAEEFWIRDYNEMDEAFQRHGNLSNEEIETALSNTLLIADRIEDNLKLGSDKPLFPKVTIPEGLTAEQYLTLKSYNGLYKYYNKNPKINIIKYEKRLCEELDIINTKGFAPYILKIIENLEYCEANDIPCGPGRGSAAGALTLFANGVTKIIDPIKYDLLFFRFLTKDRIDPPDVDCDYSYYGRDKLIKHLEEVHGQKAVAHIGTYTVLGVKSGLKDFGRVLGIPFEVSNSISKKIDEITEETPSIKFKDIDKYEKEAEEALKDNDQATYNKLIARHNEFKKLEDQYSELFRLARKFEGTPRNMGSHASGVLVMPCDVTDYFPTRTDDGIRIALFTGPQLESLGAIKLDILGLKTLDVLDKTMKSVNENSRVNDLYEIIEQHLDDKELFEMVQSKETEGLFQMESALFKSLVKDIMPTNINDICAILAIGRPGPLQAGMHTQYANRKNGFEDSIPQLRGTDEITENTYHTIIYQEQIMLIAKKLAKFNDAQTDSLCRKPLSKKKKALMLIFRKCFIFGKVNSEPPENYNEEDENQPFYDPKGKYGSPIEGAINNGYEYEELAEFYEKLKGYATYLFNKSHSATYSVVTLCTMYLKKKYPAKFLAALLSMQETEEKINLYSKLAKRYDINITIPDINYSEYDFTEKDGTILYGFKSIKGIGENSINSIIENRPFTSIEDCLNKMEKKHANKRVMFGLIKSGAFDFYNENRYEALNELMDIRKDKDDRYSPVVYDDVACMMLEKEVLGTSITHDEWWDTIEEKDRIEQTFLLKSVSERPDKKGNMMGFVNFDYQGVVIPGLVFSSLYKKTRCSWNTEEIKDITIKGERSGKSIIVKEILNTNTIDYSDNIEDDNLVLEIV